MSDDDELPPIAHYELIAYATITKRSGWWNLIALLTEPRTNKTFISLYKYRKTGGEWKKRVTFKLNNPDHINSIAQSLVELYDHWQRIIEEEESFEPA